MLSHLQQEGGNPLISHSISIVLACVGLSEDGRQDLSASDREMLSDLAIDLHRRSGWEVPPNPFRLAALEGVILYELAPGDDVILGSTRVYFSRDQSAQTSGLLAAHALAGAMLLRRGLNLGPVHVWTLAADLLVPAWAVEVIDDHPDAPPWLVGLRRRASEPPPRALAG